MKRWITALLMLLAAPAMEQQHQDDYEPYAGMQTRSIKALSDQQIADLKAGRGMGLALPAELNGYPGPIHVLELPTNSGFPPNKRPASRSFLIQ